MTCRRQNCKSCKAAVNEKMPGLTNLLPPGIMQITWLRLQNRMSTAGQTGWQAGGGKGRFAEASGALSRPAAGPVQNMYRTVISMEMERIHGIIMLCLYVRLWNVQDFFCGN